MALTPYPNPVCTSVGTTSELSLIVDNDLKDGEWAYTRTGKAYYSLDKSAVSGVPTKSGEGFWVLYIPPSPVDVDAVIFDGLGPPSNIRADRAVNQSPIDNTKVGIVNLSSDTDGALGATANYATIGGGDSNQATGEKATVSGGYRNAATGINSTVAGGSYNIAGVNAMVGGGSGNTANGNGSAICGGAANTASGDNSFVGGGDHNQASASEAVVAGGGSNTASGTSSFIGGGGDNHAVGQNSAILGGESNEALDRVSVASGGCASARMSGQRSHASSSVRPITPGSAQTSDIVMRGSTPGTVPNETVSLLIGDVFYFTFEATKSYIIVVEAVANGVPASPSANDGCIFKQTFFLKGSTNTLSTNPAEYAALFPTAGATSWTLTPSLPGGNLLLFTFDVTGIGVTSAATVVAAVRFTETV